MRQGKTYGAIIELFMLWLQGYTIYSNTWLRFPYKILTLDYLLDIVEKDLDVEDNSVFFIDEIAIWLDSRCAPSKRNRIMSYFLAQSGKLGVDKDYGLIIIGTVQYLDMCDKRMRKFRDKDIECQKFETDGKKHFLQTVNVWKGNKSYSYNRIVHGNPLLYSLYDTRKKIKYIKDRYSMNEKELNIVIE